MYLKLIYLNCRNFFWHKLEKWIIESRSDEEKIMKSPNKKKHQQYFINLTLAFMIG